MKKKLIVSGCSFTDKHFSSPHHPDEDFTWPKWPELLAEKLGMECVNLARSGQGNEFIYTSLLDEIMSIEDKSEIGLIIPAWTQTNREDYQVRGYWHRLKARTHGDVISWVNTSLRYYTSLQLLCERYNLPYYQFQMLNLYYDYMDGFMQNDDEINPRIYRGNKAYDTNLIFNLLNGYEHIDSTKFLGWPIAKEMGGYVMSELILGKNYWVSPLDDHPNEIGHQKLAEAIYDRLG